MATSEIVGLGVFVFLVFLGMIAALVVATLAYKKANDTVLVSAKFAETGGPMKANLNMNKFSLNKVGGIIDTDGVPYPQQSAAATAGNLPTFKSAYVIEDSTIPVTSLVSKSGGTMTGALAFGGNNITGGGSITGTSLTSGGDITGQNFFSNGTSRYSAFSGTGTYASLTTSPTKIDTGSGNAFTQSTSSEWSMVGVTGTFQYTGVNTRNVLLLYPLSFSAPTTGRSLTFYVAKNTSVTPFFQQTFTNVNTIAGLQNMTLIVPYTIVTGDFFELFGSVSVVGDTITFATRQFAVINLM
jgi:hypothetical protein